MRAPGSAALAASLALAAAASAGPLPDPIVKSGLGADLVDFVQAPPTALGRPLARLNWLQDAGDGSGRVFVNDMRGLVYAIDENGSLTTFFDIRDALGSDFDTQGLQVGLSTFAFHPDFANPGTDGYGKFYTAHSEEPTAGTPDFESPSGVVTHHSVLDEWSLDPNDPSRIDPTSRREILRVEAPSRDHPMGQIAFDPNAAAGDDDYGMLYVAMGDGGGYNASQGDEINPFRTAQDTTNPYGSILRIDPFGSSSAERPTNGNYGIPDGNPLLDATDGSLQEIWAWGMRNPHRFSWDTGGDGTMLISDIGQANIEEINIGFAGANFGWSEREGPFAVDHSDQNISLPLPPGDELLGYTYPVAFYDHDEGHAVVGGFVYRGSLMPDLVGKYIFGDLTVGRIFYADLDDMTDGTPAEIFELTLFHEGTEKSLLEILGNDSRADLRFGIDEDGEIYVLTKRDGMIRRLVPEPASGLLLAAGLVGLAARRRLA